MGERTESLPTDEPPFDSADIQAIDAQASVLMKRGMALMAEERPGAASEALACFDRALDLRAGLPLDAAPVLRYGLAACWLNRADALMRLGGSPQVSEAIRSCDEAIALLVGLPLGDDPRFSRRLAMAHHNRGMFLAAGGRQVAEVIAAFDDSLAVLDHQHATQVEDRDRLRAVALMNLAGVRAAEGSDESEALARQAAMRAIGLVEASEADDLGAADVGLRARHALCRSFARRLATAAAPGDGTPDDVHDATDAVDRGLELIRDWERRGVARYRDIAADLFRFGSRVYLIYQPQFLQEFLDENLDPAQSAAGYVEDQELQAAVAEIVELHNRLQR